MYSFHRHTLKNKLELLTIPMPQVESATVMVMVADTKVKRSMV